MAAQHAACPIAAARRCGNCGARLRAGRLDTACPVGGRCCDACAAACARGGYCQLK
ncbi:MAG: hypothetical protein JW839_00285 [Candidatus Lokiarchaeota archaeon]|nr:hypothetical protein [Candidatus Lokiarchaeota archaeon]